jgi:hypothetical protein
MNASKGGLSFDIPVTVIEAVIYPYGLANDRSRKTLAIGKN